MTLQEIIFTVVLAVIAAAYAAVGQAGATGYIAAMGLAGYTPDVIRPGAVVVGGGLTWEGRKARSDVDESCAEVAGWITPRLGGVGVTTVAMLLRNTVAAAERRVAASAALDDAGG